MLFFCLFIVGAGGAFSFLLSLFHGRKGSGERPISHNMFHLKRKRVFSPHPQKNTTFNQPAYLSIYFIEVNDPCTIPCMDRQVQLLTTKVAEDQHVECLPTSCNGQELVPTSLHANKVAMGDMFLHLINALKDTKQSTLNNGFSHGLWNLIVPQLLDETMAMPMMMSHGPRAFAQVLF